MNESHAPLEPDSPPAHADVAPASAAVLSRHRLFAPEHVPSYLVMAVLVLLLLAQWWAMRGESRDLRAEIASRLHGNDVVNAETRALTKSMQDSLRELQAKVGLLEGKQAEAQSQQLALDQLYQELSRNRDDWALAEIEQVLSTASQQLQLAGNVQGALIALQNADARLSRSDKPQFILIRRALAKDLDRLKALPALDLTGIALRLDSIIGQIDNIPLLSDEKPAVPATPPKHSHRQSPHTAAHASGKAKKGPSNDWWDTFNDQWQSWLDEMGGEIKQLIRVRSVATPDALLLGPTQAYYARENLKLRLLNARLALLSRNESAFRSDLIMAQESIVKYFDTRAKQTQAIQTLLKQVQSSNLSIDMPTLAESLNAVRNYKAKP